jgi:Tol biopolymer transport system component
MLSRVTAQSAVWAWRSDQTVSLLSPRRAGFWYQACVHPEGEWAVFWGGAIGEVPRIWRSDLYSPTPEALTSDAFDARHPVFGLAGDRIVFASDMRSDHHRTVVGENTLHGGTPAGRPWNIFTMANNGTDLRQVTHGNYVDHRPSLSPDGTTVAFVSDRGPGVGIWLVPADGSDEPKCLSSSGDVMLYRPWWANTGDEVFCIRLSRERHQIGRVTLADGHWRPLSNDDRGNTRGPYADPERDCVLAHSDRDGAFALWEIPLDGSAMVKLIPPGRSPDAVLHGTRARNGNVTFDAPRPE